MAKFSFKKEIVEKNTFNLELTLEEIAVLRMLTGAVPGGSNFRIICDDIYEALPKGQEIIDNSIRVDLGGSHKLEDVFSEELRALKNKFTLEEAKRG